MDARAHMDELLTAIQRQLADTVELTAAEIRYAAVSALGILFLLVIAAAAVVIGWGLIVAAAVIAMNAAGLSWPVVTICFAVTHGLLASICWQLILRLTRNLSLPAMRAALSEQV